MRTPRLRALALATALLLGLTACGGESGGEVLDLPTDLNRTRGATIVMVLHDLDPAARYADRLMALASGRLHAAGTPEEVMTEDTVRAVYGMESRVIEDPVPGKPLVLPIGRHHSTATDAEAAAASSQHAAGSR